MKKVMFIIVGMLLAFNVNAASLLLVGESGNIGAIDPASGQVVKAGTQNYSGSSAPDSYTLTSTDGDTMGYFTGTFNPSAPLSSWSIEDSVGNKTFATVVNTVLPTGDILGVWGMNMMLYANESYTILVDTIAGGQYNFSIETPIPAALFLFAPALLGFFGLRRKAAVAA